ncbi:AGE family epimerase/isomerase [Tellurirhabdus bombi]|uniref:AGE family epimerase/isomerase n=1 Tax=Tellurirhabdus bombi TaxID=2907205 RepID=UPI001F492221|nr:AGE family epimerase/isomerase [Tellurirhabdus bombi]
MLPDLRLIRQELNQELKDILAYWQTYGPDPNGGYYGQVDYQNAPKIDAPKGIVLNSRIVWTFAAAARHTQHHDQYLPHAERAFKYLTTYFRDPQFGGVYWLVDAKGSPFVPVKQLYGQAFAVYGLSEYYRVAKHQPALDFAKEIYGLMVKHGFDAKKGGFHEAFARDWSEADDYILSNKAERETKTMNTHLHILEAFTNLYRVWPDEGLRKQVRGLIDSFLTHIIDPKTYRMNLFMDDDWRVRRTAVSYGHDIEASWLLLESAEVLHDEKLIKQIKDLSIKMARAAATGLEADGGLNYEYDPKTGHVNRERSWWVMAEAMVGFYNAYQLTNEKQFLDKALQSWEFTKKYLLDTKKGEWFSGVDANHAVLGDAKISMWKCPYHNSRACMELLDRMS